MLDIEYTHEVIQKLADSLMKVLENLDGRSYAKMFGKCPMCMDCPDNCLIEKI